MIVMSGVAALFLPHVLCAQDESPQVTFDDHIAPILREYCIGCHRGSRARNGLVLAGLPEILEGGSSGAALVPGDPDGSLLFQLISRKREPFMPYEDDPLPTELVAQIRTWIKAGAPENASSRPVVTKLSAPSVVVTPAASNQPRGAPAMPTDLRREPYWWSPTPTTVSALATSPWAPLVAVAGHKQVLLYHTQSLELLGVLDFPEGSLHVLKFSRNGSLLLAGGGRGAESGRVVGWDVQTGARVLELGDEPDVVFAADITNDHTKVAIGGPDRVVRIYSTSDGSVIYEITKHTDWITALAFSPDGVLLATADRSGGLFVWEADTSRAFHSLPAHAARVTDLSWRRDSNVLASCGEDGAIRLYEMENGRQIKAWNSHNGALSMEFTGDNRLVTCGRDRIARLWDANGSEQRHFNSASDLATAAAITHDRGRVIVGDWTGAVHVYATSDGSPLGTLAANPMTQIQEAAIAAASAIGPLREGVTQRQQDVPQADAELSQRADEANAVRDAAQQAVQAAESTEAQAARLQAAAEQAISRGRAVRAQIEQTQAAAVSNEQALAAAQAEAARTEMEMIAAQQEAIDAAAALEEVDEANREVATRRKELADKMLHGAKAVAQLAATAVAQLSVEEKRITAALAHRTLVAAPKILAAETAAELAQSAHTAAEESRVAADAQSQRAAELQSVLVAADEKARVTKAALESALQALAEAEQRAANAAASWAEQKRRIVAAGGRHE